MTVLTNVLKLLFVPENAAKAIAATDSVGRAQTRLGQSSTGAGRSFSAQSQGLGGLVGAYAGAAATIFTLEAAYTALSNAAKADTIVKGTNALAASVGQNGPKIIKSVKEITQGQLTLADSATQINTALSAGFNTQQITDLAKVSLGASRALGRDLTDAFTRVTRGVAKLEPELLDELGIFTRIEPAVAAYARATGRVATSLNEFERRQAFANAAISEGLRKFSSIDTSAESSQKSLEQLRVQVSELATEFTQIITSAILPFINFMKNDAGNALLVFGVIAALVFSKTLGYVNDLATKGVTGMSTFFSTFAAGANKGTQSVEKLAAGVGILQEKVKKRGGILGGPGGTGGFRKGLTGENAAQTAKDATAARNRFLAGGAALGPERTKDIAALRKAQAALAAAGRTTSIAYADTTRILRVYTVAAGKASLVTRGFAAAAVVASRTVNGLAIAFSYAQRALGIISVIIGGLQLVGSLFDVDMLGAIKDMWVDSSQAAKDLANGITSVTAAVAATKGTSLDEQLRRAGASDEFIENLADNIAATHKLVKEREDLLASQSNLLVAYDVNSDIPASRLSQAFEKGADPTAGRILAITTLLEEQQAIVAKGVDSSFFNGQSAEEVEQARGQIKLLQVALDSIIAKAPELSDFVGAVARTTGLTGQKIAETLLKSFTELDSGISRTADSVTILGTKMRLVDGMIDFSSLSEEQKGVVESFLTTVATIDDMEESLNSSSLTSERLSQSIAGATAKFMEAKDAAAKLALINGTNADDPSAKAAAAEVAATQKKLDGLLAVNKQLAISEALYKGITSTFSKEIKLIDSSYFDGLISAYGKIADNEAEILTNQAAILQLTIDRTAAVNTQGMSQAEITAAQEVQTASMKAIAGRYLAVNTEVAKLLSAEQKRTVELKNQLAVLSAQSSIARAQASAANASAIAGNNQASASGRLDIFKQETSMLQTQLTNRIEQKQAANGLLDLQAQIASAGGGGGENKAAAKAQLEASKMQLEVIKAEQAQVRKERDPTASRVDKDKGTLDLIKLEEKVFKENFKNQIAALKAQSSGNAANTAAKLASLDREAEIVTMQIEANVEIHARQLDAIQMEYDNLKAKIQADLDANARALGILELQRTLDELNIAARQAALKVEGDLLAQSVGQYTVFAQAIGSFGTNVKAFAEILSSALTTAGLGAIDIPTLETDMSALVGSIDTLKGTILVNNQMSQQNLNAERVASKGIFDLQVQGNQAVTDGILEQAAIEEKKYKLSMQNMYAEQDAATERLKTTLKEIELKKQLAKVSGGGGGANIAAQIAQAEADYAVGLENIKNKYEDAEYAQYTFGKSLEDLKKGFASGLSNVFTDLNAALFDTSENAKSLGEVLYTSVGDMFKTLQADFFKQTIADPVSEWLSDTVFGLFNVTKDKGIDEAKVNASGALLVTMVDDPAKGIQDALLGHSSNTSKSTETVIDGIEEKSKGFFGNLFGEGGIVSNLFSGLFGDNGILSGLLGGFGKLFGGILQSILGGIGGGGGGGIFSSIASAIFGGPAKVASGGPIHMSAGGSVPNLRDKVPAMLEPGEFVLRKRAAQNIGRSGLNAMNAGGMGTGNVSVNITNNGTPQEATAGQPKFDGEKFVIDIVTKDMANNGAIRRSMRSGGAG